MSTSARLNAAGAWKSKYKDIIQAQARRSIPREELAEMPKISDVATVEYNKNPNGVSAMVLCENHDDTPSLVNESEDESGADDNWETSSSTSSVDSAMGFFQCRYTADDQDLASTTAGEDTDSNHSENSNCHVCLTTMVFDCRDYCLHKYNTVDSAT
jgi:hypothetical protein